MGKQKPKGKGKPMSVPIDRVPPKPIGKAAAGKKSSTQESRPPAREQAEDSVPSLSASQVDLPDNEELDGGDDPNNDPPHAVAQDEEGRPYYPSMFLYKWREQARKILSNSRKTMCFRQLVTSWHLDGVLLAWDFIFARSGANFAGLVPLCQASLTLDLISPDPGHRFTTEITSLNVLKDYMFESGSRGNTPN